MRWPWKGKSSQDQLVVSWSDGACAYVRARTGINGQFEVRQMGVERQGSDSMDDFVRRLQDRGLKSLGARAMLRPSQYQLLQIDAPPVEPEELRAAARFQIRDMVSAHIDDITLDVMQVGDGTHKGPSHLFVVAATNAKVREVIALADAMDWGVTVIDVQETAQRNLQSALARQEGALEQADAALVISGTNQALLTISANEELFFARSLDLPEGFLGMAWGKINADNDYVAPDAFTPVKEYVPDYAKSEPADNEPVAENAEEIEQVERFLVEVQRSLDLWGRTWSSMPLAGVRVYAGERSGELARWLSREMGRSVTAMDLESRFTGLRDMPVGDQMACMPLLGVLLRTETRKL